MKIKNQLWKLEAQIDSADQHLHQALSIVRRMIADPAIQKIRWQDDTQKDVKEKGYERYSKFFAKEP